MNKKIGFSVTFIFVFSVVLLLPFWVTAEKAEISPVAVSPGSETEAVTVWQSCPTFSWSAVDKAASYRLDVFESIDANVATYEGMTAVTAPVISKDIPGPALSWTLSAEERLKTGRKYAWYVQALDASGNALGSWSNGRIFKVEQEIRFAGIEEKLGEILKSYGVNEETILNVLEDMKSEVQEVVVRGAGSEIINAQDRSGVQGTEGATNTFYGLDAGKFTTGKYNTFIGRSAGYTNTTGELNTFIGFETGYSNTSGVNNTFIGRSAGSANTTGNYNTLVGFCAGYANTTGELNNFIGFHAGYTNTTGNRNTFLGNHSGFSNTTGSYNTFLGNYAGYTNTTGELNTFIGYYSGYDNTIGNRNTFLGNNAGADNTEGNYNTFLGNYAGYKNTTANDNVFIGYNAGFFNDIGFQNTFLGRNAGYSNTEGESNTMIGYNAGNSNTTGDCNTFIGRSAGASNTIGDHNTVVGFAAGFYNTTGKYNTLVGYHAGKYNSSGDGNTFLGYYTGHSNNTGYNNTFLGNYAGYYNSTGTDNLFLGYKAGYNETGSNKLYIDNSDTGFPLIYGEFDNNIMTINGKLGIGTKTPAYPMELNTTGTNACFVLKRTNGATSYINATNEYANFGSVTDHPLRLMVNSACRMRLDNDNSLTMTSGATCTSGGVWTNASSRDLKENIECLSGDEAVNALHNLNPVKYNYKADKSDRHVGFIAEDVPELVATEDRKGMSPMDVVAVLTKVVQEQQNLIQEQQKVNQEYKKIIDNLQERMTKIEKK